MRGEQKDKPFAAWEHLASAAVEAAPKITTMAMNYDLGHETLRDLYDPMCDYVRYRELELLSEMIRMRNVPGAVAEAGVDMGQTSAVLSRLFPDRELFLYDTFEGFPEEAVEIEVSRFAFNRETADLWKHVRLSSELIISRVQKGLLSPERSHIRKGVFPASAHEDRSVTFAFVLLDMDMYQPMLDGLFFFYPRLAPEAYLMLHDYNTDMFEGTRRAFLDAEKQLGPFTAFPLPDQGGSLVIQKPK